MGNWSTRLKERMKEMKMTQEVLAKKMGITRGAITHYLSERRTPSLQQFKKLSAVLKTDPAWLQFGISTHKEPIRSAVKNKNSEAPRYAIPILPWNAVAEFMDARKRDTQIKEFIPHIFTDQVHWYALRVMGDSMKAPSGNSKSFQEGDLIIVDPNRPAIHGSFVLAMQPRAKEATFKQYVVDGGISYLKPLNPQYPTLQIDEATDIGGVIVRCVSSFD